MPFASHRAVIRYYTVCIVCSNGPIPFAVHYESPNAAEALREDGAASIEDDGLVFRPFSRDYKQLGDPRVIASTNWGGNAAPSRIEILVSAEDDTTIPDTMIDTYGSPGDAHWAAVKDSAFMALWDSVIGQFITTCDATLDNARKPPTWGEVYGLWQANTSVHTMIIRERLARSVGTLKQSQRWLTAQVPAHEEYAASGNELGRIWDELAAMRNTLTTIPFQQAHNQRPNHSHQPQGVPDLGRLEEPQMSTSISNGGRGHTGSGELADILGWGPLFDRLGSWAAVKEQFYKQLLVDPNARKPVYLQRSFMMFDMMSDAIFARYSLKELAQPVNHDLVDALQYLFIQFYWDAQQQMGRRMESESVRASAYITPLGQQLETFMKRAYHTRFVSKRAL